MIGTAHPAAPSTMILLDPDLDPESPHGQRPVRGKPGPASTTLSAKPPAASIQDKNHRLPSARTLARFLIQAQAALRLKGQVTVLLTTDAYLRKLNRQFRGKNKATDVLSFLAISIPGIKGAEALAGDLAISVPTALRQAVDQGHSLSTEIKILILHGLLHLAGYDHEADDGKMARRERQLRARLNLPQGLIERAVNPVSQKSVILSDRSAAEGVEGPAVRSAKQRIKLRVPQVPILGPGKPQTPTRKRGQKP